MTKSSCFSFTVMRDWCLRSSFTSSGFKSTITDLGDGTVIHCWVPKTPKSSKPNLLLIHGFGANALWQWFTIVDRLTPQFNLYIPDLVFFGDSYTTRNDRTDSFQAECLMRVMEAKSVTKMSAAGLSYGGFVAYRMAAMYEEMVEKVVICCAGVCLEEEDIKRGMFKVGNVEAAADILLPQTPEKLKELMELAFVKPPKIVPSCFLNDFIHTMCTEYVQERRELIRAIPKDRTISEIPKISQPTLIIWGDRDQVFPIELAYRLKGHVGDNAELVVMKNAGHALNVERPKEFYEHLKAFLTKSSSHTHPTS